MSGDLGRRGENFTLSIQSEIADYKQSLFKVHYHEEDTSACPNLTLCKKLLKNAGVFGFVPCDCHQACLCMGLSDCLLCKSARSMFYLSVFHHTGNVVVPVLQNLQPRLRIRSSNSFLCIQMCSQWQLNFVHVAKFYINDGRNGRDNISTLDNYDENVWVEPLSITVEELRMRSMVKFNCSS